jgi:small subunit ribosomal protein S1
MHQYSSIPADESQAEFLMLLEQSFQEMESARRGDILTGTILAIDRQGIIIDLGLKRDGVVQRSEFEALGNNNPYEIGQKIKVMVIRTEDQDGNLVVSISQARASKDWDVAEEHMENGSIYEGEVVLANHGGLIVPFGNLRGFVPASHVLNLPRGLDDTEREQHLRQFIGQKLSLKIIEVNPQRRRLVFSQREAQRESRDAAKERLLSNLSEGDIVKGMVSSLRDFGAFVDLGGADGLIHVSELSWHRVRHPRELLSVGMEIEAYVLQLDQDGKRIGLSLKRLEPNPWSEIAERYAIGQEVEGTISRAVSFGAFIELDGGIEALLHVSQMPPEAAQSPEQYFHIGQRITAKIISLEAERQRIGLSVQGEMSSTKNISADVEPMSADVEPVSADVEPVSADVEPVSADVEPVSADVEPVSADVEPVSADVEPVSADVEPVSADVEPASTGETVVEADTL